MLVSAIMPTSGARRRFIPQAIRCFMSQSWEQKELIILDDGDESLDDLIPELSCIFYVRIDKFETLGAKRNYACELASGRVILHWDDDDWSAPGRMADQVERLIASNKSVAGYHSILFYDENDGKTYIFSGDPKRSVIGTSLCYRKDWWYDNRFKNMQVGEDVDFTSRSVRGLNKQLITEAGGKMMVARIHDSHTSPKDPTNRQYTTVSLQELPEAFVSITQTSLT